MADANVAAPPAKAGLTRIISASSAGTLIEWYDFYIFGSFATVIAKHYFPDDPTGLLKVLGTYATGFVVRPIGAIFFGRIGDLIGRKYTFMMTLVLHGRLDLPHRVSADVRDDWRAGAGGAHLAALFQGLALGGEYGGAAIYVAENSPDNKRGLFTSFIQTTASLGLFVSLAVVLITSSILGDDEFKAWGWRIPFLLSIVLVIVSYYIRRSLSESPMFAQLKGAGKTSQAPLRDTFANAANLRRVVLTLLGATAGQGVIFYTSQYYAMIFMQTVLKIDLRTSSMVMAAGVLIGSPFFVVFGALSDRVGRKPIMMAGAFLATVLYYPLFAAMSSFRDSIPMLIVIVTALVLIVCLIYGPIAAYLVESFPTRIRYTSMSFPYHIGNGVFGGLTRSLRLNVLLGRLRKSRDGSTIMRRTWGSCIHVSSRSSPSSSAWCSCARHVVPRCALRSRLDE